MLLSIVPTADSILPPGPNGNQRAFAPKPGHFMERSASVFGNVVRIKAGLRHRTILQALLRLCRGTIAGFALP